MNEELERLREKAAERGKGVVRAVLFLPRIADAEIRALFLGWIKQDARQAARQAFLYLKKEGKPPAQRPSNALAEKARKIIAAEVGRIKLLDLYAEDFAQPSKQSRKSRKKKSRPGKLDLAGPPEMRNAAQMIKAGLDRLLRSRGDR